MPEIPSPPVLGHPCWLGGTVSAPAISGSPAAGEFERSHQGGNRQWGPWAGVSARPGRVGLPQISLGTRGSGVWNPSRSLLSMLLTSTRLSELAQVQRVFFSAF